jgi:hypothetical protein
MPWSAVPDDLMLVGGVIAPAVHLIAERASHAERYTSLVAFERCVVATLLW